MNCSYCGNRNNDLELRCRRCGRKPDDTLTGEFTLQRTDGALATQLAPVQVEDRPGPMGVYQGVPRHTPNFSRAIQRPLFHDQQSNVVGIETYAPSTKTPAKPRAKSDGTRPAPRRVPRPQPPEEQGTLDFLPPAADKPRTLGTTVEAVIFCEDPVATLPHRTMAAMLDTAMVLLAYGLFLAVFRLCGGEFVFNKTGVLMLAGVLPLLGCAYGLVWAIAGTETAGMRWANLRLTTFDGFRPEPRQHLLRLAGSWLSLCTGVGLLWAYADEESLGWQDHMSRTFPTPCKVHTSKYIRR